MSALKITDFTTNRVYGPFASIAFRCINQSFPLTDESTVTYTVWATDEDEMKNITVSLVHAIEIA